jgi:hypothetical protein
MRIFDRITRAVSKRRAAYRAIFAPGPAADDVLNDLRKFCRATTTPAIVSHVTQQIDPIATGIAIGRLEVWHRISQHLNLTDADIYNLVNKGNQNVEE